MKLKYILPFLFLLALFGILCKELFFAKPNELPSALIGEPIPRFTLPDISQPKTIFTQKDLTGHISLLNIWASWCTACETEAAMLMKIKTEYHIPIYGIDYKDNPKEALSWLKKNGNPYVLNGNDEKGDLAIDLGVYGTPETFIINAAGKIIYRHIGAIDQKAWDETLYPIINQQRLFQDNTTHPLSDTYPESMSTIKKQNHPFDVARYDALINEIRCVVCQNQSIADSSAPLAKDLREKITVMMTENKSDEEIKHYLVQRYGEFILLRPPFNKFTIILWTFPFVALGLVVLLLTRFISRTSRTTKAH